MSKGNKKQRREAKRREKRREMRRKEGVSPLKRLAEAKGEIECWKSPDFETGQMQLFAYKWGAGLSGMACFLVDQGVVGLKDSWTRMNISREDFTDMIEGINRRGLPVVRASVDEVRRVVAGGMRWAHEHGMRLPADWAKHTLLIGGVGDWKSADVSDFVKEFVGHPIDLRQRLIGEPMETFLKRKDIQIIFSDDAPYNDEESGNYEAGSEFDPDDEEYEEEEDEEDAKELGDEELESIAADFPEEEVKELGARLTPTLAALVKETGTWLAELGKTASPELFEAWKAVMISSMLSKLGMPDGSDDDVADFGYELLRDLGKRIEKPRAAEFENAVGQALDHLLTDPMMMQKFVLQYGMEEEKGAGNDKVTG